jgi:DnaK suppressor protein
MSKKIKKETENREEALVELKEILIGERKKIVHVLQSLEKSSSADVENLSGDSVDFAAIETSQKSLAKFGTRNRKLLEKIDYAIAKFEDGTYGVCELTGEDIPIARLRARPVAQYTVEAKEELERRERHYARKRDADDDPFGSSDEPDF